MNTSWWLLKDVFCLCLQKTSSRRPYQNEDNIRLDHTFSEDVFKASSKRLDQDEYICLGHTFSKNVQDFLQKCLQDISKTSSRRFQDVLKIYNQVKLFLLTHLQYVFKTFLSTKLSCSCFETPWRRIQHVSEKYCKDSYLQKDLPTSNLQETYGQGKHFPRVNSLDIPKLLEQFF